MPIKESGENYLETIYILQQEKGTVRSIDVANTLGFSKPSISRAMSVLRQDGAITVDAFGSIQLTEKGLRIASSLYERHQFLSRCLKGIGVSPDVAVADACRIEHVISQESFDKLKGFVIQKGFTLPE